MSPTAPAVQVEKASPFPYLTHGHTGALEQLRRAFEEARPVAILVGERTSSASYLLDCFVDTIDSDVTVARLTAPCPDADAGMRGVVQAVGLDPKDVSLADLENAFTVFLSEQSRSGRRTVICFEETQDEAWWVFETVRRLIELQAKGECGLMVILSGRPGLNELLVNPSFDVIRALAGPRIVLGPFTLLETREYVSREVEAAEVGDIDEVFEFDAVTLIHELCSGVLDRIDALCCKCIDLADKEGGGPVSADLVKKADKLLGPSRKAARSSKKAEPKRANGARFPSGKLIARMNGVVVQEQALNSGRILIGRDKRCDIPVTSSIVSRRHAVVVNTLAGLGLVDLGSKNGTFVDGRRIKRHLLQNGDLIAVGDCTITYFAGDDRKG
ncbi:MAG: FHA domain-containing protein [Gammaproteobacteria bacterium]|nr:FHA domain-containing protein [Gammaproteobacteria bacterium]